MGRRLAAAAVATLAVGPFGNGIWSTQAVAPAASATWTQLSPASSPTARYAPAAAYDPAIGRIVLYGGYSTGLQNDTWTFDGSTWALQTPATNPGSREMASMAYDPAIGKVVLFGGLGPAGYLNSTWTYDGSTWTNVSPATSPSPRLGAALAYDPAIGKLVLFGGEGTGWGETWTFDGTSWTRVFPATSPPGREEASIVYDEASATLLLFGGLSETSTLLDDTWSYDGSTWTQHSLATRPPARDAAVMAYDPALGESVLFGGYGASGPISDTWTYAAGAWTLRSPSASPPARSLATMAFHPGTGRMILFGGNAGGQTKLGDTWSYAFPAEMTYSWVQQSPASSPTARQAGALAYYPPTGKLVLFGGMKSGSPSWLDQTWTYDGTTWTLQSPATSPSARYMASMTYDPAIGKLVLFGGLGASGYVNDTWTYDGTTWTLQSPATSPPARYAAVMAYDPAISKVVLFSGGASSNDTWTYDGTTWTQVFPTTSPSTRSEASMAYDPALGKLVLFGGDYTGTYYAQTWTFDGSTWELQSPAVSPTGRATAGMDYDPSTASMVLFGGLRQVSGVATALSDTWTYDGSTWTLQSPSDSPTARKSPYLAFDDARGNLLVFGGYANATSSYLSDTWVYRPYGVSATAPAAPAQPNATPGNAQVGLSWTAPSNGGSAITGYTVAWKASADTSWTTVAPDPATSTSITIGSLSNGTGYDFKVLATNAIGDGPYSPVVTATPSTVPAAPVAPEATAGDGQVSLTWTAPSNGGSAVTSYTVAYKPTADTSWATVNPDPATSTSMIVGSLANGTSYDFKVLATNVNGDGPYSIATTATPNGEPAAPAAPLATPGNAQVGLSWTAPSNGGSAITGYTVAWKASADTTWTTVAPDPATSTSITIGSLSNGTGYDFKVLATNAIGDGPYSPVTTATPSTTPAAPAAPEATPGNAQVSLSWSAPSNGGSAVTGYTVAYKESTATSWTTTSPSPATNTSIVIDSLTNGVTYEFKVMATNANGDSGYSPTTTATPSTTPSAPAAPVATPGNGHVDLSWTAPDSGGSLITGYTVAWKTTAGTTWSTGHPTPASSTAMTISSLTNGTSYDFKVLATNANGDSGYSPVTTATPASLPAAPTAPTPVPGNGNVTLEWSAPTNGGSPITGYTIAWKAVTDTTWSTVSPTPPTNTLWTIDSLTNGVAYEFKVCATNAIGDGPYSSAVTATPSTLPSAPATPTATPGNSVVTVSWTAPDNGGSAITGYSVAYKAASDTVWTTVIPTPATSTSMVVAPLTNGVTYSFKVLASNANGDSGYSPEVSATPAALPSAGTAAVATTVDTTSVSLTWSDGDNGGAVLTDHKINVYTWKKGNKRNTAGTYTLLKTITTGSTSTSYTVTGLSKSKDYAFTVAGVNSIGTGAFSTYSNTVAG